MASQIELELLAETRKASKSIDDFGSGAASALKGVESGFSAIKTVAAGAVAVLAAAGIANAIGSVTTAARAQEDAVNKAAVAMKTAGDFSKEALDSVQDFASALQDSTGIGDELSIELFSVAKAYGATNEQAKNAVEAAAEFAAATGKNIQETLPQVAKTLGGFAGELGELNPAIKALTSEQLKNGDAIKILLEQYGGSAAGQLKTFSGAITNLSGRFGDFQESIGEIITQNPVLTGILNSLAGAFQELEKFVDDNRQGIVDFVGDAAIGMIDSMADLAQAVEIFAEVIENLPFDDFETGVKDSTTALKDNLSTIQHVTRGFLLMGQALVEILHLRNQADEAVLGFFGVESDAVKGNLADTAKLKETFADLRHELELAAIIQSDDAYKKIAEDVLGIESSSDRASTALRNLADRLRKAKEAGAPGPGGVNLPTSGGGGTPTAGDAPASGGSSFGGDGSGLFDFGFLLDAAARFGDPIIEAANIAGSTAKSLIDTALGGLSFFQDIFSGGPLVQLSDQFQSFFGMPQKFAESFKGLDDTINGLLVSFRDVLTDFFKDLPQLTEELVRSFGSLVDTFVKKAPEFAAAIGEAIPDIVGALVDAIPKLVDALPGIIEPLIDGLVKAIDKIFDGLPAILTSVFNAIPKIITALVGAIPDIVESFAENIDPIVEAFVVGLIGGIGEIVAALIESLLVEGGLERIVGALLRAMPRIAVGLVDGVVTGLVAAGNAIGGAILKGFAAIGDNEQLNQVGAVIATAFGDFFGELPEGIATNFKNIGGAVANGFKDLFDFSGFGEKLKAAVSFEFPKFEIDSGPFDKLIEAFKPLTDAIKKLTDTFDVGGGGDGGFLGNVGRGDFGEAGNDIAEGGKEVLGKLDPRSTGPVVPRSEVLPPNLSASRSSGPTSRGGGDSETIVALLTQLIALQEREVRVSTPIEIDGKQIADVILTLSKQNARLAA